MWVVGRAAPSQRRDPLGGSLLPSRASGWSEDRRPHRRLHRAKRPRARCPTALRGLCGMIRGCDPLRRANFRGQPPGDARLLAEQRADRLALHVAELAEQRALRRGDVQRRGDRAACRRRSRRPTARSRGSSRCGRRRRRSSSCSGRARGRRRSCPGPAGLEDPGTNFICSACWAAPKNFRPEVGADERGEVGGGRDDRARRPRAARAEEARDVAAGRRSDRRGTRGCTARAARSDGSGSSSA